ncbi:hypothetical protein F4823DRAFT_229488 [Ustulina deusta]|nr:hypothetical protein F4823DRAFT_229488 [Ustulina deusta]
MPAGKVANLFLHIHSVIPPFAWVGIFRVLFRRNTQIPKSRRRNVVGGAVLVAGQAVNVMGFALDERSLPKGIYLHQVLTGCCDRWCRTLQPSAPPLPIISFGSLSQPSRPILSHLSSATIAAALSRPSDVRLDKSNNNTSHQTLGRHIGSLPGPIYPRPSLIRLAVHQSDPSPADTDQSRPDRRLICIHRAITTFLGTSSLFYS